MKLTAITNIALLSGVTSGRAFGPGRVRARQALDNLQTFEGDVGSAAPDIKMSGNADRPFEVNGAAFQHLGDAATRSCDVQFNSCSNEAKGGARDVASADCTVQKEACLASVKDTAGKGNKADSDASGATEAGASETAGATEGADAVGAGETAQVASSTVAAISADATGAVDANGATYAPGAIDGAEEDQESSYDESSTDESSSEEDDVEEPTEIAGNATMAAVNATAAGNSTGFANRLLKARGLRPNTINDNADAPAKGAKLNPLRARVDRTTAASNEEAPQEKRRRRVIRRSL